MTVPDPGEGRIHIRIQREDFDLNAEVAALRGGDAGVGAVCAFVGTVRDHSQQQAVTALELEHYPGMTERSIRSMMGAACERFGVRSATVIHRIGMLSLQDQIVLVAVGAAHRGEAFQSCEFLMDYLKTRAPFWKKEHLEGGGACWVDAREDDELALRRWTVPRGVA